MGQVTKDNARRSNVDATDRDFDFMKALFGGPANDPAMANVGTVMELIDQYLTEHYGAAGADGEIDVRAHLVESKLTVKTPPDAKTVAALRALADALEWAIQTIADGKAGTTSQGDGARV